MALIDSLLKKFDAPSAPTEKAAAAKAASLDDQIAAALAQLPATEKTAAATDASPVKDLMKLASEVAAADEDANIKLASRMGTAFVDAQVARMREYEKAAEELAPSDESVKQAAYEEGYNETVDLIYKSAAVHFVVGHDAIIAAIEGT